MEQGKGAVVGTEVGAAEYGPLAPGQRSIQVLAAADLDEFPQGPGPAPQQHHVDDLTGPHPEEFPGQALSLFRAELVTEHLAQVTHDLGALPGPVPETPVPPPAGDTVGQAGGQARCQRRHCQPVGNALRVTQQSLRADRPWPASRYPAAVRRGGPAALVAASPTAASGVVRPPPCIPTATHLKCHG